MSDTPGLPAHGTNYRYYHRTAPCRCDECKAARATYMRTWRSSWGQR